MFSPARGHIGGAVVALCAVGSGLAQDSARPALPVAVPLVAEVQREGAADGQAGRAEKSVTDLHYLFAPKAQAAQLGMRELHSVYQEGYAAGRAARPWWEDVPWRPTAIAAALVALLSLVLGEFLKEKVAAAYQWLWEKIYQRLAGTRLFRRVALRRYRAALVRQHRTVKIPFRPDRPLEMDKVFVRLQVAGSPLGSATSAEAALADVHAGVILGPPGSGKSMLLRKLALDRTRAAGPHRQARIPVLVELSRFEEDGGTLRDRLTAAFAQNDFPRAEDFIKAGLSGGFLLLLLDGLDEVGTERDGDAPSARDRVVAQIEDLIATYPDCQFLITCRSAVYHGELDACVERRLQILEFDDTQIHAFLAAWAPEMPADKSIEQLLRNLRERPRILALARNPLMLTIIAFLYTDTEFVLPHSRAEFYARAVSLLLDHWKLKRNRYRGNHKAIVLQQLALWNQELARAEGADRRTIELTEVLAQIQAVLPSLTLPPEEAQPMLDEITDRSGLLLALDDRQRYQFSHLTLQEFLAAQQLAADGPGLIERYRAAPDDWRETVKLWCGLPHDSTSFLETLRQHDPALAFECLSDAEQVADPTWRSLLEEFQPRLGQDGPVGENIVRSFGLVAADPRPRGRAALAFLVEQIMRSRPDPSRFGAICRALALTNLPKAAEALCVVAPSYAEARRALILMGDIAVAILRIDRTQTHFLISGPWRIQALHEIGSVAAARALVEMVLPRARRLIVDSSLAGPGVTPVAAAWALASLLRQPAIEVAIEEIEVSAEVAASDWLWVWEPFAPLASNITRIVSRIAQGLAIEDEYDPPDELVVDPRLAIPHCLLARPLRVTDMDEARCKELREASAESEREEIQERWMHENLAQVGQPASTVRMLRSLRPRLRYGVMTLAGCSRQQWQHLTSPLAYKFGRSWQSAGAHLLYASLFAAGGVAAGAAWHALWPWASYAWVSWLLATAMVAVAAIPMWDSTPNSHGFSFFTVFSAIGAGASLGALVAAATPHSLPAGWALLGAGWSLPALLVVLFHECCWQRRRRPPFLSMAGWVGAAIGPGVLAWALCELFAIQPATFLLRAALYLGILVAVGIAAAALWGAARSKTKPGTPVDEVLVLGSLAGVVLAAFACALWLCGAYSLLFACDHLGLPGGAAAYSAVLLLLAHCLGSATYQERLSSNPFHKLLTDDEELGGFGTLRSRLLELAPRKNVAPRVLKRRAAVRITLPSSGESGARLGRTGGGRRRKSE